ncbi:dihydroorotate oxidase [Candidatus Woesearchaeota archaeon]|nr:dihydroorotate oxidase [Candidatus Woesearchaeota archaeon]
MSSHISTKAAIAGITIEPCIFNAAGPLCVTKEELEAIGSSHSGAIMTKSCTFEPRPGNPEPRYYEDALGSINSMGLPNLGYMKYAEFSSEMKKYRKPYIVSVAGLSLQDNIEIVKYLGQFKDIDAIELNLSCPNVIGKPQVAYDFDASDEMLREVLKVNKHVLGVKLSPYFDFAHFQQMAGVLKKHKLAFVSCVNSLGEGLFIDADAEQVAIKPKGGFGGIGGDYIKPTALANVRKFYELLDRKVPIVGVGGIKSGRDAFEFILAGATAVQIGTEFMRSGTACFARVDAELKALMKEKGYSTLDDFRGKLKVL